MSVVGFMAYYAHHLDFPNRILVDESRLPIMLQAGYSYGAMITTRLPPLDAILALLNSPAVHTPAADIRLRAQHLAEQQNVLFVAPPSPRRSLGMRVGGDEDVTRLSHERRRSHSMDGEERIIKGVKDILAHTKRVRRKYRRRSNNEHAEEIVDEEECLAKMDQLLPWRGAYLVVSPPIGFVTNLATMSFTNPFNAWSKKPIKTEDPAATSHGGVAGVEHDAAESKLAYHPSLAIYGDSDGFLTLRKFREWTNRLKAYNASEFQAVEVAGAGHFWMEKGVTYELRNAIVAFVSELLGPRAPQLRHWEGA